MISEQTLFFRASASCSKNLNDKKYIQYRGYFTVNSVFQDNVKKFQYGIFSQ